MKKDPFARLLAQYNALNARADRLRKRFYDLRSKDEFLALAYYRAAESLESEADALIYKATDYILVREK